MSQQLEVIDYPAKKQPAAGTIVILHGWGANHHDLGELAPYFNLPEYRFLFPNGIFDHEYTDTGKMWYSFTGAGRFDDRSTTQRATSRQILTDWVLSLPAQTGTPLDRTWIAGFSQGGAMTLDIGLDLPVAGLIVLSGYLHPDREASPVGNREASPVGNREASPVPPVLIVHGRQDNVVPLAAAQQARSRLTDWGGSVTYQEFDMGHTIVPEVLNVVRNFVTEKSNLP